MISAKLFEGLTDQLSQLLGEVPQQTQQEVRNSVGLIVQNALSRLELVTREEFDAQSEVLARTRVIVEQLEQRLVELETESNEEQ